MDEEVQPINNISPVAEAPKNYNYVILGMVLVVILVVAGIFSIVLFKKQQVGIKDCKDSLECFASSVEEGKLSQVLYSSTVNILGAFNQTSTSYLEIESYESGQCSLYLRHVNASAEYPAGTPQSVIDTSKQAYATLEGKEGTCVFNQEELVSLLNRWEGGLISTSDFDVANCTGNYFGWNEITTNTTSNQTSPNRSQTNFSSELPNNESVLVCFENWTCSSWTNCTNSQQTRTCTDVNNCGTTANKPVVAQACTSSCTQGWVCYDDWSSCSDGKQTRTCQPTGNCEPKIENRSCSSLSGVVSVSWSLQTNESYSDPQVNISGVSYTPYYSACSYWCTLVPGKSYSGCESSANSGVKGERVRWDGNNWQIVSATDHYSDYITIFNCKI